MTKCTSVSLPDDDRVALEAERPCHNDDVLARIIHEPHDIPY